MMVKQDDPGLLQVAVEVVEVAECGVSTGGRTLDAARNHGCHPRIHPFKAETLCCLPTAALLGEPSIQQQQHPQRTLQRPWELSFSELPTTEEDVTCS